MTVATARARESTRSTGRPQPTLVDPAVARLLPAGLDRATWPDHVRRYGPLSRLHGRAEGLREAVAESGLTGRGGGGFPTATKLRAVAAGGDAVVVANGTEGEPASAKDKVLMSRNPHLVIDGVLVCDGSRARRRGVRRRRSKRRQKPSERRGSPARAPSRGAVNPGRGGARAVRRR